jgi:magnesium-transporting ATPase (P-type)
MALCSDARYEASGTLVGDPTEVALTRAASQGGIEKLALE